MLLIRINNESCMPMNGIQLFFYINQNQKVILYTMIATPSEIPTNALALFVFLINPTSPNTMAEIGIGSANQPINGIKTIKAPNNPRKSEAVAIPFEACFSIMILCSLIQITSLFHVLPIFVEIYTCFMKLCSFFSANLCFHLTFNKKL